MNEAKAELCLFCKNDTTPITITINNCQVRSRNTNNGLGFLFDSKLTWMPQNELPIPKANKALNAIKLYGFF